MELKTLENLLNVDQENIGEYTTDQLRLTLGVVRYFTRFIEREIIRRESGVDQKDLKFLLMKNY